MATLTARRMLTFEHDEFEYEIEVIVAPYDPDEVHVAGATSTRYYATPFGERLGPFTYNEADALKLLNVPGVEQSEDPCIRVSFIVLDDDHYEFEFGKGVWSGEFIEYDSPRDEDRMGDLVDLHEAGPGRVFIVHKEDRGSVNLAWTEPFKPLERKCIIELDDDPEDCTTHDHEWVGIDDFDFGDGIHHFGEEIFPDPIEDLAEASTAVWDEWTRWANGDCWGVITYWVDPEGNVIDTDSVWGLIGSEYANEAAKEGNV